MRQSHRWSSIFIALPFLLVIVTGILLQLKKEIAWIQPPTQRGSSGAPTMSMDDLLAAAKNSKALEVEDWSDIARIDIQPKRNVAKIQANNRWEAQIDLTNGSILQTAYRRSDLIESLHDGSWFHEKAKLWFFLPVAVTVLGLWVTGIYLFALPIWVKRNKKNKKVAKRGDPDPATQSPR